jgi:hypothetical protein
MKIEESKPGPLAAAERRIFLFLAGNGWWGPGETLYAVRKPHGRTIHKMMEVAVGAASYIKRGWDTFPERTKGGSI